MFAVVCNCVYRCVVNVFRKSLQRFDYVHIPHTPTFRNGEGDGGPRKQTLIYITIACHERSVCGPILASQFPERNALVPEHYPRPVCHARGRHSLKRCPSLSFSHTCTRIAMLPNNSYHSFEGGRTGQGDLAGRVRARVCASLIEIGLAGTPYVSIFFCSKCNRMRIVFDGRAC